jgi:hypothetical protein
VARNVSFKKDLSGFCGLSHENVRAALRLPNLFGSGCAEVQKHFDIMEQRFGGYHFYQFGVSSTRTDA